MKEAMFYRQAKGNVTLCSLCHHNCRIKEGRRGLCGVRENRQGRLYSLVYGRVAAEHVDPIEKKPLFHFLPGSTSYSISTVGCNFFCEHCQNYQISQYPHAPGAEIIGRGASPEDIVTAAASQGCASISYTYVEPTIFYEFAHDCAVLAKERGIRNVLVSNGYMGEEASRHLAVVFDAINIDVKAFTEEFYRKVCKAHLTPVLDNVRLLHDLGVWVEVTTLIIPGLNDSDEELRAIAGFVKGIDPAMPWHVSAFYPTYKMLDRLPTPAASILRARQIGLAEGLHFVYVGNIPGQDGEDTTCPACGTRLISRRGYWVGEVNLAEGCCPECGSKVAGVWG